MIQNPRTLNVGMVGLGMIFEETYLPLLASPECSAVLSDFRSIQFQLHSSLTRTGLRADRIRQTLSGVAKSFNSYTGNDQSESFFHDPDLHIVVVATPDSRHFQYALAALEAGKHVLIEKPSVLDLHELDQLMQIAEQKKLTAKILYHKLFDPDHRMLRTHSVDGRLSHVNNGYCSLLEPKTISDSQFAEWITGRNPASYVAVHYLKLIDFTFGPDLHLSRIEATGQRGLVGPHDGPTWDSVQLRVVYQYPDHREATFDIHTSWVNPETFPGYVEQEVQFRFDNAVWNAHQRKRGVELAIDGKDPRTWKITPNHHYNAETIYPGGERRQTGYGIEAIRHAFIEIAEAHFSPNSSRIPQDDYNSLHSDRPIVAAIMATEALLNEQLEGHPGGVVFVNHTLGGLVMFRPGVAKPRILYQNQV